MPKRGGFGARLIERSLTLDLDGSIQIDFAPCGVICTVDAALPPADMQPAAPS